MGQNPAYTVAMRNATEPEGTGGNPRVGVPVRFSRPQICFAPLSRVCIPYLPSSPHTILPPRSQAIKDSLCASPDDVERAGAPQNKDAPIMLQAEGHPTANRVRDVASPSTLEISPYPQPSFRLHSHPRPALISNPHFTTHLSALIAAPHPRPHSCSEPPLAHVSPPKTIIISPISRPLSWSLPPFTLSIPPSTFSYPARSLTPQNSFLYAETLPNPPHPNQ